MKHRYTFSFYQKISEYFITVFFYVYKWAEFEYIKKKSLGETNKSVQWKKYDQYCMQNVPL